MSVYISFEGLHLGPGEGVRLADDGYDVDAVSESLHQLQVQGLEAVTHRGEEVEERVDPGRVVTDDGELFLKGCDDTPLLIL